MNFSETRIEQFGSLQDRIKFKFSDIKLLNKALTHRSYENENNKDLMHNERLEFLGDSVLDILVSDYLVYKYD